MDWRAVRLTEMDVKGELGKETSAGIRIRGAIVGLKGEMWHCQTTTTLWQLPFRLSKERLLLSADAV